MADPSKIIGDLTVAGHLAANTMTIPASSIRDANVASDAGISSLKLQQQYVITHAPQKSTETAVSTRYPVFVARATGTIVLFRGACVEAPVGGSTTATVVIDLFKNGTTVLSAVITINNGHADYEKVAATVASAGYVAGDVFEVDVTVTPGTGATQGKGPIAQLIVREAAE